MPTVKLTDRLVKHASGDGGRVEYWDAVLRGFGLRVADRAGAEPVKTWFIRYRMDGRQHRLKLGTYPAVPLAAARSAAETAFKAIARGENPAAKVEAPARPYTVADMVAEFIERHAKPNTRSWAETNRILQRHVVSRWGAKEPAALGRRDVIELLDAIADAGAPIMANRTLAHVRKLFGWAVERDILSASPVANVKPPAREQDRDRVLSDDEVRAIWDACDGLGWPFGPIVRLLLVTAQRRDEVATMRREDLQLEPGLWVVPRTETKSDRLHEVPLSPLAVEVLAGLPQFDGPLVFSTTGVTAVSGFSKAKLRLDDLSGVSGWRFHDLRRTAASGMARLGVAEHTLRRILNHAPASTSGVTAVYNRYAYLAEKRAALDLWARHVEALIGRERDNVVRLPAG